MDTEIVTETVDVTDDLDAFSNEFYGTKTETAEEITPENVPSETTDENEGDAPDPTDTPDDEPVDEQADDVEKDDDATDSDEDEETPLFKVRRKKSVGERIREITAAKHEAERRAVEAERRLAEATAAKSEPDEKPKSAPAAELASDAPDPDTQLDDGSQKYPLGEFDPKYIRDLTRYTINVEREAAKAEDAKVREEAMHKEAEQALQSHWTEKLTAAKESLPDLGDKAVELEDTFRDINPDYGKYLASTIMSMDMGPQVLHYLATNIGEARKIVASGPTAATLALGRIEARFVTTEKARNDVPRPSKAPTPPPTNRGSGGKFSVAPDTDDLDAFSAQFFNRKK